MFQNASDLKSPDIVEPREESVEYFCILFSFRFSAAFECRIAITLMSDQLMILRIAINWLTC